jgi:tetratricopeptide (TPR) repeat protein
MNRLSSLLISALMFLVFLGAGLETAASVNSSGAINNYVRQQNPPLTLTQIEALIKNRTPDNAVAIEIRRRGIDFTPTPAVLGRLRGLGAGGNTLRAIETAQAGRAKDRYPLNSPQAKVVILVADFSSDGNKDYRATQMLLDRLSDLTRIYPDIEVKALGEPIPEKLSRNAAIAKGKEYNASIVIWGWLEANDEAVNITAYFEILPRSIQGTGTAHPNTYGVTHELIAGLSDLKWFKIQARLGSDMTALSLITIGLARFQARDYKGAISQLTQAIDQDSTFKGTPVVSHMYVARGAAYLYDPGCSVPLALNDFNEAIRIDPKNSTARAYIILTHLCARRHDKAITTAKTFLEDESDVNGLAVINLAIGVAYYDKGEIEQARPFFDRVLQLPEGSPPNPFIILVHALAYLLKGDYKNGSNTLDRVTGPIGQIIHPAFKPFAKGLALVGEGNYD